MMIKEIGKSLRTLGFRWSTFKKENLLKNYPFYINFPDGAEALDADTFLKNIIAERKLKPFKIGRKRKTFFLRRIALSNKYNTLIQILGQPSANENTFYNYFFLSFFYGLIGRRSRALEIYSNYLAGGLTGEACYNLLTDYIAKFNERRALEHPGEWFPTSEGITINDDALTDKGNNCPIDSYDKTSSDSDMPILLPFQDDIRRPFFRKDKKELKNIKNVVLKNRKLKSVINFYGRFSFLKRMLILKYPKKAKMIESQSLIRIKTISEVLEEIENKV